MDAARCAELVTIAQQGQAALRTHEPDAERVVTEHYVEIERAFDWFLDQGDDEAAARLASVLVSYWMSTGEIEAGSRWFDRLLSVPRPATEVWARALHEHGYLVFWAGDYDLAKDRFAQSREMAQGLGDRSVQALALAGLARVVLNSDAEEAVRLLRTALDITENEQPPSEGRSSALHVLGVALQMSGDLSGARAVIAERLDRARADGDVFVVWTESANLAMVERQLGNLDRAEELSRQAVATPIARSTDLFSAWTLNGLAAVTAAQGRHDRAATILGSASALLASAGGEWPPDERVQYDQTVDVVSAAMTGPELTRARARGAAMTREEAVDFALQDHSDP